MPTDNILGDRTFRFNRFSGFPFECSLLKDLFVVEGYVFFDYRWSIDLDLWIPERVVVTRVFHRVCVFNHNQSRKYEEQEAGKSGLKKEVNVG